MDKTIWIINQYASTPETGMGGRHYYFAKELAKQGYKVYLIAASYTHILRKPVEIKTLFKVQQVANFSFIWVRSAKYSDAHDKRRTWNWLKFSWDLLKLPKIITDKPNVILCSSPSIFAFLGAQRLATKFNAKLIFDVRDIWPLSLIELSGYSPNHPFIRLMQWVEDKAYRESDVVLSNFIYAYKHMESRGMKPEKFTWIPNGFDLEEISNQQDLPDDILSILPTDKFIIGYTGTIGLANSLDSFIKAAELTKDNKDLAWVLVGNGREKGRLKNKAEILNLKNIFFIDAIAKNQIQNMLNLFDVCYVGFNKSKLYQYGNSLNKLPEYLMSEKPIIYAIDSPFKPIDMANAGITIPAEDPAAIVDAVLRFQSLTSEERSEMGQNGKDYALKHYDYAKLAIKLSNIL